MDSSPQNDQIHADQIAYWNGPGGARWVAQQAHTDTMLAPVAAAAIAHAAPRPDQRVLDIGCGCGLTTLTLADMLTGGGHVIGLDVSAPMLEVARRRTGERVNITWQLADAATHPFPQDSIDLLFSRFGVMFFGDPVAAFANLRRAVRPGGRLVFACWRDFAENPWMMVPFTAVAPHVPDQPPPVPGAPGPFAFADQARVERILTQAGWSAPRFSNLDVMLDIGGGQGIDAAVAQTAQVGAAARALQGQPDEVVRAAMADVRTALLPHTTENGVMLAGAIWLVTAD